MLKSILLESRETKEDWVFSLLKISSFLFAGRTLRPESFQERWVSFLKVFELWRPSLPSVYHYWSYTMRNYLTYFHRHHLRLKKENKSIYILTSIIDRNCNFGVGNLQFNVHSLLRSSLRLFEDSNRKGSVIIQGLEELTVHNKHEVYKILKQGTDRRRTACTQMNIKSRLISSKLKQPPCLESPR